MASKGETMSHEPRSPVHPVVHTGGVEAVEPEAMLPAASAEFVKSVGVVPAQARLSNSVSQMAALVTLASEFHETYQPGDLTVLLPVDTIAAVLGIEVPTPEEGSA